MAPTLPFRPRLLLIAAAITLAALAPVSARPSLGLDVDLVANPPGVGDFPLVHEGAAAPLFLDPRDHAGVLRAAGDLQADIEKVTGIKPELYSDRPASGASVVVTGTLGRNAVIDRLAREGKIDAKAIAGKRESFLIATVSHPMPGVARSLVIAGSDKRGTIYGIYELSEQIGVSPWHWWADVPVERSELLAITAGSHVQGPPVVEYRGIFLNDEEPALGPWARRKFGGVNSKMYAHVFELILRLRGNYLWPAMWGKAFNEDDPLNPKLADEYGIVMGTSHHEPMMRAQQEWTKRKNSIGNGEWNYATNRDGLHDFWRDGIRRNKDYENIVTLGMRGDGDEPMIKGGDMKENLSLLETIVADQRKLISQHVNRDVTRVPQVWALYKEVSDYYDHGMRVPDDVTLLWCDDNWGNIRRLPTAAERKRSGGAGVYYHFDYVGGPRSYKWINTNPLPKVWEQMNLAHAYGANRIWIVNVGDLKPMELPIEFFLRMAWDPEAISKDDIGEFTRRWAERDFGAEHAAEIADIVGKYAKYNAWRKPELLSPTTYSLVHHREAERVLAAWKDIANRAERLAEMLEPEFQDAFYQLVLYPAKASANIAELLIATGINHLHARQGRASANDAAARVRELFALDRELTEAYHKLNGGKWDRMMAQTKIGYTSWRDPETEIMPELKEVTPESGAVLGVAVEGSEDAWPGASITAELPTFESIRRKSHYIEVFRRGDEPFDFTASADQPWVKLSTSGDRVNEDLRLFVDIDWATIPAGTQSAMVSISRSGGESVPIRIRAIRDDRWNDAKAFGGLTGSTAIAAEDATANVPFGNVRWERIPDHGRGDSGISVFPVTAPSTLSPHNSPRVEYPILIPEKGEVRIDLITNPSLNFQPDRGVRIAVSLDDQNPQIIDAFSDQDGGHDQHGSPAIRNWGKWVSDNSRIMSSTHQVTKPGVHTLKVHMVDPGVVLESIILHLGDPKPSYFGPPVAPSLSGH
ncbi:MAG: glycosyl hydrolase 115 family protein [Akkermansiaceae bacterium]|nr:glycosyl hydrolase 115 family protein [Akkermansiaceae bacterium]